MTKVSIAPVFVKYIAIWAAFSCLERPHTRKSNCCKYVDRFASLM